MLINLMLGLCSIPWLLHISRTVGNFPGIGVDSTGPMVVAFFLRNALGYAGLPRWIEPPILALLTFLAVAGLWAGRRSGNRPFTTVCGAGLFVYPVLMLVANEKTPILAARIFIPSVVPLVTLAGLALAQCSLPWLRRSIAFRWRLAPSTAVSRSILSGRNATTSVLPSSPHPRPVTVMLLSLPATSSTRQASSWPRRL